MAGHFRGPSIKHKKLKTRLARVNFTPRVHKVIVRLANEEQRSLGNMMTVLATEALKARGLL